MQPVEQIYRNGTDHSKSPEKIYEVNFEEAFELTGHGKINYVVLFTCGLIMLNVSMESVGMSYVVTAAECDLQLSSEHKGLVTAAAFIGIISTSFLWGYLGDRLGRRAVMLPAILASALVSIISSFSTNIWMLVGLRILAGCLVSASSATVYAYLGEMHTGSKRAAAIAWGSAFISFSFILLPALAWLIIPGHWSLMIGSLQVVPWRAFMCTWCIPGLVAALFLALLPESPRYLFSAKGPEKALPVLAIMYTWNFASSYPVKKITSSSTESGSVGFAGALRNIVHLLRPPLLRCVLISHVCMFAVFLVSSGLYMWVPDILNSVLQDTSQRSISICGIIHNKFEAMWNVTLESSQDACTTQVSVEVFPISMGMGAVFALVYLAIGVFINKIGRKTLYCGIMFIGGLATVGAAYVPQGGVATVLVIVALCTGCSASILAAIAVDVFPTCLRAMAMCVMYMVGRLGAAVGSSLLGATLNTHCQLAFSALGVFLSGSTLLMLLWPKPEKIREDIERKGLTY